MPTLRFEGASLEEAVDAARGRVGRTARIVGASKVRRGGVAGFFARESIEVEVQVDEPVASAPPEPEETGAPARKRSPFRRSAAPAGAPEARSQSDDQDRGRRDPMTDLIEEMASSGPSSVLDLAEVVNAEQSRFGLAEAQPAPVAVAPTKPPPAPAPRPVPPSNFARVLERIAKHEGLVSPDHADEIIIDETWPSPPAPVQHARTITTELGPPAPRLAPAPAPLPEPARVPGHQATDVARALQALGVPLAACQSLSRGATFQALEAELSRVLETVLLPLPPTPRSAASVVAVVGPKGQVLATARTLAADLGQPEEEVALATPRNVWRQQRRVVGSPEAAVEERRSWRWRDHPSVVAIETVVRPDEAEWAAAILRSFGPSICWGVAPASHKPEDLVAWSGALGGVDALAVVDLASTTSPAAVLSTLLPVGLLEDQPATAGAWAKLLCSRLVAG